MRYKTFGPDAEVYGAAMLAFVKSVNYENFSQILKAHGIEQVDPSKWYPQQLWLDVFSDISSGDDASANLVSIGMKIADTAPLPAEVTSLPFPEIMLSFNKSYTGNNRGKDIGEIETRILGDTHILMVDKTPYPDHFVYGAYYAMARRFLPRGTKFTVKFDPQTRRREEGGNSTNVHITWE